MSDNKVLDEDLVQQLQAAQGTITIFQEVVAGLIEDVRDAQKTGTIQEILERQSNLMLFVSFIEQARAEYDLLFEEQMVLLSQQ